MMSLMMSLVIITKINGVLPYPPRNNLVKFHRDLIRFSRVMLLAMECPQTDNIMMTIPLILTRREKRSRKSFSAILFEINAFRDVTSYENDQRYILSPAISF